MGKFGVFIVIVLLYGAGSSLGLFKSAGRRAAEDRIDRVWESMSVVERKEFCTDFDRLGEDEALRLFVDTWNGPTEDYNINEAWEAIDDKQKDEC